MMQLVLSGQLLDTRNLRKPHAAQAGRLFADGIDFAASRGDIVGGTSGGKS